MCSVLLKELDGTGLSCLQVEELCHELDLLVLSGEFNLVALQDGALFLDLYHQRVHTLLQDASDLSLYGLCRGFDLQQFTLDDLNLVHYECLFSLQSLIVLLHLVLGNVIGGVNLDELVISPVMALGHP